ncbi:hypothetical protein LWI28_028923 [Acer negundo]|uniref:FAR1 domain-containing protein n=1 Tax=Acer negundo TaxID=4023 RepID=A0AAD5J2A8_ACENE|nr:hypothetical protein LWI28_028923 [Acer negundo]
MSNTNSKRRTRLQTRVGCKAHFSVSLDCDTNKYIVRALEENHCHELATFCEVAWVRSHKNIDAEDLSQIDAMGNCCIRPCLTYEYTVNQKGGYSKIGFTQKEMFSTEEKDMLANIFWRDSHSLFEYQFFDDVLVFDSTYKINAYAKPLVLFVSVNNHRATCVFGVALLSDVTVQ